MMKTINRFFSVPVLARPLLCMAVLAMAIWGAPTWAGENENEKTTDEEQAERDKAEQAKKEAEEKRKAEEMAIKAQFPYSFNDVAGKIVTIECKTSNGTRSSGSGFIGSMDGKNYVFTNQHVLMGMDQITIQSITGDKIIPRGIELSATRDIARLPLSESAAYEGFVISDKPALDMLLAVFGNSEGRGVATELYGKVTGVTADLVEVSAGFVPGNSGSPALNQDQEVVGIVSYLKFQYSKKAATDAEEEETEEKTRRFCYRLTEVQWRPVNWNEYNSEYGSAYLEAEEMVDSVFDIVYGWQANPYGPVEDAHVDYDLQKWAREHNHMVNTITRLSDKGRCSQSELDKTNKKIQTGIERSAEALSKFCMRKSRHVAIKLTKKDMTGFLRDKFDGYVYSLEIASEALSQIGQELSVKDYFHFEKKTTN